MKNNFKRILSIFLVAVMCLSLIPASVFAADAVIKCPACEEIANVTPEEGGEVKEATCDTAAGQWYVCSAEHYTEDNTPYGVHKWFVPVTGSLAHHSNPDKVEYTPAKAPKCNEDGNVAYYTCTECGKNYSSFDEKKLSGEIVDVVVPMGDAYHRYIDNVVEPVCGVSDGYTEHTCEYCDDYYTDNTISNSHEWTITDESYASDEIGCMTECDVTLFCGREGCGASKVVKGYGWKHETVEVSYVAPTCSTAGHDTYYTCRQCDKLFADVNATVETTLEEVNLPAQHTLSFTAYNAATCVADGNVAYYTCSGECGNVYGANPDGSVDLNTVLTEVKIEAAGHDVVFKEAKTPDCVEDGYTAYYDCKNCDLYFAAVAEGDTAYTDAKVYYNGAEITVKAVAKDSWLTGEEKRGHDFENKDAVVGNCTTVPTIAHKYCAVCEKNYAVDADEFEALENALESILAKIIVPNPDGSNSTIEVTPDDALYALVAGEQHSWVYTGVVNPTCFLPGWTTWTCSGCGEYTGAANAYSVDLAPTNHSSITAANIVSKVEPTCVQTGMDAYAQCPDCNKYFAVDAEGNVITDRFYNDTNAFVLPTVNTNHNVGVVIAGSTVSCLIEGKPETHICTWCWTHYYYVDGEVVNIGAFSNSNFAGLVGYEEKHTVENGKIVFVPAVEATCADNGNVAYYYCADCNKYYAADADDNIVNAYNADNDWIGYVELADVVTTRAHDYGTIIAATYNCGVAGYDAYYVCQYDDCKKIFDADKNETTMAGLWRVATGNHDHSIVVFAGGQTVVDGQKACKARILKCSVCSDVVTVSTHNFFDRDYHYFGNNTAATCAAEGCYAMECSYCEEYETDENGDVIKYTEAKKPHGQEGITTVLAVAPDCIKLTDGNVRYNVCNKCGGKFEDDEFTIEIPDGEEIIPVTHTPVAYSTVATVCGGEYAVDQFKCSVCGRYALTADTAAREWTAEPTMTSVATSHTGDLVSNNDYVDSDCLTAGHKETFTCNGECGKTYILVDGAYVEATEENVVIDVKPHNGTLVAYKAPTCTDAGNVAYFTACTNGCGKIYGATDEGALDTTAVYGDVVIAATGHTQTDANTVAAVASVCNGKNSITDGNIKYYVCDDCHKMFADGDIAADAVALNEDTDNAVPHAPAYTLIPGTTVPSKCTEIGYSAYVCDCEFVYYQFTAPLLHNVVAYNDVAVSEDCSNDGLKEFYYCDNCDTVYKDADCTDAYTDENGDVVTFATADEAAAWAVIPATGVHLNAAGKDITAGGCDENVDWICAMCEQDFQYDHVEWLDIHTDASCMYPESFYKQCKECGKQKDKTEVGEPNGVHPSVEFIVVKEAECVVDGYGYYFCNLCEKKLSEDMDTTDDYSVAKTIDGVVYFVIAQFGHEWDGDEDIITPATCTTPGVKRVYCSNSCGEYTEVEIPTSGVHTGDDAWVTNKAYIGTDVNLYTVADAQARYCSVENCEFNKTPFETRAMPDVNFAVSLDNGVVAGATLVNSGKLAVTIKLSAFKKNVNILNFSFNYSDNLTFAGVEYGAIAEMFQDNMCEAVDGVFTISSMEYDDFFNLGEVEINGADLVYAVVYFDIDAAKTAGTVTVNGLSVNELKGIDGEPDAYTTGKGVSVDYTILGDIDGDGVLGNETQTVMQILASGDYNASVDFDKDGEITVADFMAYRAFTVNGDYSALVSSKS